MKQCGTCGIEKDESEFYKRSAEGGLKSACKRCYNDSRKEYCKAWAKANPDKANAKATRWKQANRGKVNAYNKKKYAESSDNFRARVDKYREANPEKVRAATRTSVREWAERNPEVVANNGRKRRASERGAEGSHSTQDVRDIFAVQNGLCIGCDAKLIKSGANKYHVDHIVPLCLGGTNWPENIQLLCPTCNMAKGGKHPDDWISPKKARQ